MSQEAQAVVESLKAGNTSVWVFPGQNPDTPIDTCNFYQRIYLPAVKATGLDAVTWHTLRHTFASRLAMKGASDGEIAASLRHASNALVKPVCPPQPIALAGSHGEGFGLRTTGRERLSGGAIWQRNRT